MQVLKEFRRFIVGDEGVHSWAQLLKMSRTVGCLKEVIDRQKVVLDDYELHNPTRGKKGAIGIVPKPSGEHISSLYVGIHAILA